jgi:Zn-dependent protease with chaperone function
MPGRLSKNTYFPHHTPQVLRKKIFRAVVNTVAPSIAYLLFLESIKFHAIRLSAENNQDINSKAKEQVKQAYRDMGCGNKAIYFCDAGFDFPYTLTSIINPKLVLFSCKQPKSPQEYDELYALAGHEAVHTKENDAIKNEFGFLIAYNFLRLYWVGHSFTALACSLLLVRQLNKRCEFRADAVSAKTLDTNFTLCRLFHQHHHEHNLFHPTFKDREANIRATENPSPYLNK